MESKRKLMKEEENDDEVMVKSNVKKNKRVKPVRVEDDEVETISIENGYEISTRTISDNGIIKWCEHFLDTNEADELYKHLLEENNWQQSEIKMWGKPVKIPRLQSWMADEDLVVKGLFQTQKQKPWSPPVTKVRNALEKLLNCKFDYLLLNYYRDGKDYIGFHADNEASAEGKNIIASISLGAKRRFLFRHKKNTSEGIIEYSLTHGSLVVMLGDTQKYWKHSVPKELKVTEPRINMTFRIS